MDLRDGDDSNRPAYSEDGVDLTLIRWMLSLTPAERLATLQQYVDSVLSVRAWNSEARLGDTRIRLGNGNAKPFAEPRYPPHVH